MAATGRIHAAVTHSRARHEWMPGHYAKIKTADKRRAAIAALVLTATRRRRVGEVFSSEKDRREFALASSYFSFNPEISTEALPEIALTLVLAMT